MTIRDFFWAYIDLWVESNKSGDVTTYDQCVDAWRVFNRKIIKAPDIFGNPPDIWEKYQSNYYERIPNTPEGVPQLGDVIVWGTNYGKYGHIAICTEIANTKTFTSFDQNDPLGSPCHFQPHTYTGVLGWLRPKDQLAVAEPQVEIPEVVPDTEKIALQTQVTTLKEHFGDISKALEMPMSEDGVDDMVKKITKLVRTAQNYVNFVQYVAKGIGCAEVSETAVRDALVALETHISAIKTQRLEEFGEIERIVSGLSDLIKKLRIRRG